jgi:SAF domain
MTTVHDSKETGVSNPTIAAPASPRARRSAAAPAPAPGSPAAELASKPGLRMRPHRPMRALAGALVVVASVVAALALYARIGERTNVLAVSRDVLAGEQIGDSDLKVVSISSDDGIPTIPASQRSAIVGQYARVRVLSGSLLSADSVQPRPIVDPERVLMSVVVPAGLVPVGLREQSRVVLVVTPPTTGGVRPAPVLVEAVIAAVPRNLGEVVGSADAGEGSVALAVEVPPQYVGAVGEAEAVSVGVLDGAAPFPSEQVGTAPDDRGAALDAPAVNAAAATGAPADDEQQANLDGPTTIPPMPTTTGPPG